MVVEKCDPVSVSWRSRIRAKRYETISHFLFEYRSEIQWAVVFLPLLIRR